MRTRTYNKKNKRRGGSKKRSASRSPDNSGTKRARKSASRSPSPQQRRFTPLSKEELKEAIDHMDEITGIHAQHGHVNTWDVSKITDMSSLFHDKRHFNQPLDKWNVSHVVNFESMFDGCFEFNQPLHDWKIKTHHNSEISMVSMFKFNYSFNQNIESWNVSEVIDMYQMFDKCQSFNQPLNKWNVSKVKDMSLMFLNCYNFNQPINNWNVSNVKDMQYMFCNCLVFNQNLNNWNVSSVVNMIGMFQGCTNFNQSLKWDISDTVSTGGMFKDSKGGLGFVPDEDCENEEDPISFEKIPKERGFRLEVELIPEDGKGRCYDAESLLKIRNHISPMTRKPFTKKDIRRIENYKSSKNHT